MESNDPEDLRAKLQMRHFGVVQAEIDLIQTLIESSRIRSRMGFADAAADSLARAQRTLDRARQGLCRIDASDRRASLEAKVEELAVSIADFGKRTTP